MQPTQRSSRRRPQARPCAEMLETRSLLTGGAGNTFAIMPGAITTAGGTTTVTFTLDPAEFHVPKNKFLLGIDVAPVSNSTIQPMIKQVVNAQVQPTVQAAHSAYGGNPHVAVSHSAIERGPGTKSVLVPITIPAKQGNNPISFSVQISAQSKTSGNFLLGFYLPGDANGDGTVDQTDVAAIKAEMHLKSTDTNYTFDADSNRDGRIGQNDVAAAQQNLGVATTVTPVVTANLDPATVTGSPTRVTSIQNVHFTGQGTPGAKITFSEINHLAPDTTATVDSNGNYGLSVPLGVGMNTFKVTSVDGFGQTITGQISPVTYTPVTAPTPKITTSTT